MSAYPLRWLLPLALLNGLLFLVLLPPWQHYDEPTHFEYAALIAYHGGVPTAQAVDPALRREIVASMDRHNFYPPGTVPDLFSAIPARPGFDQSVHPPLYYALAAIPIRITQFLPIEWQLYSARLLSLGFYLLAVLIAWRITTVITPDEPQVQALIPLIFIATPAYTDIMTAVNNDVLVNVAALCALLAMAHLIRTGLRPAPLILLGLALIVALLTKRTGLLLLPIAALTLFWAWRRAAFSRREGLWIGAVGGGALAALAMAGLRLGRGENGLSIAPRPWLIELDTAYLRLGIDRWLTSGNALSNPLEQLRVLADLGLKSFWLRFGWSHLSLGALADQMLIVLITACMVGLGILAYQQHQQLQTWERRWIWLMFSGVVLGWLSLAIRFEAGFDSPARNGYVPRGRYIFTMMVPHIWLLALGWQGLMPPSWRRFSLLGLLALFAIGTAATWAMLYGYYWA